MDVSLMLNQTIQTLSLSTAGNDYQPGEIDITANGGNARETERGGREASSEEVEKMIQMLDKAAASIDDRISFEYNNKTRHLIMRITDPETKEIVRQMPSKEMIHLLENLHDMIGMFIDDKR